MLKSKKIIAQILALVMVLTLLAACAPQEEEVSYDGEYSTEEEVVYDEPEVVEPEESVQEMSYGEAAPFETNDESITMIEVNQVMSYGESIEDGSLYPMDTFVAGKATGIFVRFSGEPEITQDGAFLLNIYKDGEQVGQLVPSNSGVSNYAFFQPRSISDIGDWAAGNYTFEFIAGESVATRGAIFRDAKDIKVLAVPVLANYAGNIVACEGEWQTAIEFTAATYPLGHADLEYELGSELDLSDAMYDLTTEEGMFNVWQALANLQTPNEDYELIVGFVRNRQGDGSTQGYTYGLPANIVTESDGDMQPTVAHEIAHCYNIGDEYEGGALNQITNPAPYGMSGSDYNDRESEVVSSKEFIDGAGQYGNPSNGTIIPPEQVPYNASTMQFQSPTVASYMGSGSSDISDYWTTSAIWEHLYAEFTGASSDSSGAEGYYEVDSTEEDSSEEEGYYEEESSEEEGYYYEEESSDEGYYYDENTEMSLMSKAVNYEEAEATVAEESVYVMDFMGRLTEDGEFTPSTFFSYETDAANAVPSTKGQYTIEMQDASGAVVASQMFDVTFYTNTHVGSGDETGLSGKQMIMPVNETVVYPEDTATIVLKKDGEELYSTSVSENAPEVEFTGIEENESMSGVREITWTGSDADGDELAYELWYVTEDDFINIASDIKETSYEVDFDKLEGSEAAYFYLYVSDGTRTSEIDSPYIVVEYKAPEIISVQETVPEYKITDEIVFDADVYDMQDGWLWDDDQVVWYDAHGNEYMTGSLLWVYPYELTPGEHTFTLVATNSMGMSSEQDFTFNIIDDESALPQDWSQDDVKYALANGFIAPLNTIENNITRGQLANLMGMMYSSIAYAYDENAELPEYEEGVVTDCGNDDYEEFLMVHLGLMEAPDGKFNPNTTISQEEALSIMYGTALAAQGDDPHDFVEEDMIADFEEIGVINDIDENAYDADANATIKLSLVRCSRLYSWIFEE